MFDRTREIETARFRIIGENKILRFIERNREDRERIESRTKNLSIRFIDFVISYRDRGAKKGDIV